MATNTRGGNRGGNRSGTRGQTGKTGKTNNPEGHNQFDRGWVDSARERPFTAAAAVGGAVAAGVFLWSRRDQISNQIAGLSEQISEWREGMTANSETTAEDSFIASPAKRGKRKSQSDIAEEALTLKATGKTATHPTDSLVDEQIKVGAVAY